MPRIQYLVRFDHQRRLALDAHESRKLAIEGRRQTAISASKAAHDATGQSPDGWPAYDAASKAAYADQRAAVAESEATYRHDLAALSAAEDRAEAHRYASEAEAQSFIASTGFRGEIVARSL